MKVIYQGKEILGKECKSFFDRLRGFMFKREIDYFLYFGHCNSIHTFFMKEAIDVVFCDDNYKILYYFPNFVPNRIILPKKGVKCVFEFPVDYFHFNVGDRLDVIK